MKTGTPTETGHKDCFIWRHVAECGALWSCRHGDERVYWEEEQNSGRLHGPISDDRVVQLREEVGHCV